MVEPFYDGLAAGLPVADALRAAKLERLRHGAPAREWASFVAVGDPLIRIPLRRPPPGWRPWAVGLTGVVALLGAILYFGADRRGRMRNRRQTVG
jgi:hypothetical protein